VYPTIRLELPGDDAFAIIADSLLRQGFRLVSSFDLQSVAGQPVPTDCSDRGEDQPCWRYRVLLVYRGHQDGKLFTMAIRSQGQDTFLILLDGAETEWLSNLLPLLGEVRAGLAGTIQPDLQSTPEERMSSRTVVIPNINCGHCTHAIEAELNALPGVRSVAAEVTSKQVWVEWGAPATWDQIEAALVGIDYPPAA
jgi:copper chaperone CopZ